MITIDIPFKLLSYNGYYRNTRTGKRVKTGAGLAYDEMLEEVLLENASALEYFGRTICQSKDILEFRLHIYNTKYYIKDKSRLNKKTGDIDNYVKVLQDKVFKYLKLDDYQIKSLVVKEYPSADGSDWATVTILKI